MICAVAPVLTFGQDVAPVDLEIGFPGAGSRQNTRAVLDGAQARSIYHLRVEAVKVVGRWADHVELPLKRGDTLTPEKLSAALEALKKAITKSPSALSALRLKGETAVLYIAVNFSKATERHTVEVTFRPYYVHVSLVAIGNNVLPIPRTASPTFYENVPKPLLALNPAVGFSNDRAFGPALFGGFKTDLLSLSRGAEADSGEKPRLELDAQGTKSLDEAFYRSDLDLRYTVRHTAELLQELAIYSTVDAVDEPFAAGEHTRAAGSGSFSLKLKPAPTTRLWIDAGYRRTDDEVHLNANARDVNSSANEQIGRVMLESIPRLIGGFVRAAFWEESGWQSSGGDNAYQRFAVRFGYEREFPIVPNQAVGLELIAGAGHASGSVPDYALFFGGNTGSQFLYDTASSASLQKMPTGPLIRSFGQNEAMLRDVTGANRGADTYWHANLNLALPIPWLSRSLIPNETTDLTDKLGNPITIKQLLQNQIDISGPNMLSAVLKNEGLSQEQADARAKEILDEVAPAARFIINQANLYAIKPLVMLDVAGMSGGGGRSETWVGTGGGLQLTVVTAKLEAGYMRTVSGSTFGRHDNLFVRLVFQNLF